MQPVGAARVQLGVMTVSADPARVERTQVDAVVGRIAALGHEVVARAVVKDDAGAIRERLGRWLDDPEIDAVIISCTTGATPREALLPLVTKVLPGVTDAALCGSTFVFVVEGVAPQTILKSRVLPLFDPDQPHHLVGQMPRLGGVPQVVPVEKTNEGIGVSGRLPAVPQGKLPSRIPALVPAPPGFPVVRTPPLGVPRARVKTGANVVPRSQVAADPPTEPLDLAEIDAQMLLAGAADAVTRPVDLVGDEDLHEVDELGDVLAEPPLPNPHPGASARVSVQAAVTVIATAPARPSAAATRPVTGPAPVIPPPRMPTAPPPVAPRRPPTEPPPSPPPIARRTPTEPPPPAVAKRPPTEAPEPPAPAPKRRPTGPPPVAMPLPAAIVSARRDMFADPTAKRGVSKAALLGAGLLGALVVSAVLFFLDRSQTSPAAVASAPGDAAASATPVDAPALDSLDAAELVEIELPPDNAGRPTRPTRPSLPTRTNPTGTSPGTQAGSGSEPAPATGSAEPPPEAADSCDEAGCVLSGYDRPCCEQYRPKTGGIAPRINGKPVELDKTMVRAGTAIVKPRIVKCGEKHPAKGTVKIAVKVSPDGVVTSAEVTDAPDGALGACVADAMTSAKFGETVQGGAFTVPFVF